jgi:hypothetical protein
LELQWILGANNKNLIQEEVSRTIRYTLNMVVEILVVMAVGRKETVILIIRLAIVVLHIITISIMTHRLFAIPLNGISTASVGEIIMRIITLTLIYHLESIIVVQIGHQMLRIV